MKKAEYYNIQKLLDTRATYKIAIGQKSNGKSYGACFHALKKYCKNKGQVGIIRRWKEDFGTAKGGATMFSSLSCNGDNKNVIYEQTGGEYIGIRYWRGKYYFTTEDGENPEGELSNEIFGYAFPLSIQDKFSSGAYPNIKTIIFDEFITRSGYLKDEFILFQNLLSSIIRDRDDVEIFMLGNTIWKDCPYFIEMGLNKIDSIVPGEIQIYQYNKNENLTVAIQRCEERKMQTSHYFAFDNPALDMITNGEWQVHNYPRIPIKILPKMVLKTIYVKKNSMCLTIQFVRGDDLIATVTTKTTPLMEDEKHIKSDWVYGVTTNLDKPHRYTYFMPPPDKYASLFKDLYDKGKVFYGDNMAGECMDHIMKGK